MIRRLVQHLVILAVIVTASPAHADDILVELRRFRPQELQMAGFELENSQKVTIDAVGIRYKGRSRDLLLTSAWILDGKSREVVWHLSDGKAQDESDHLRKYRDEVTLAPGRYEVYYSTWPLIDGKWGTSGSWFKDLLREAFEDDFDYRDFKRAAKDFEIVVRGRGAGLGREEIEQAHRQLMRDAVVSYRELQADVSEAVGLRIDQPVKLDIYAVGELSDGGSYDYSWMVDTATRKVVWKLDFRGSAPAGGAEKNRMVRETISLPAGSYALFVATDDSHHFDDWNAPPPYDPYFWGVTIQLVNSADARHVKMEDYRAGEEKNVVLRFAPLRDDEFRSEGFTLQKAMRLRVYAIGEGHKAGMADYSRILNADTHETVWQFDYLDSDHAGGAAKNRVVNLTMELPAGNYMAYAVTDGSHSYGRWNAAPPLDADHWGLTIYAVDGNAAQVSRYEEKADKNVLAQILRVGDNDYERQRFKLDKKSEVHIYALGEGNDGRMYDYAWIENVATGQAVWEMTYRATRHAGGAEKNRVYDDDVLLEPGEYMLYYESDGSHSFNRWNAKPPSDMWNWGVTVRLARGD